MICPHSTDGNQAWGRARHFSPSIPAHLHSGKDVDEYSGWAAGRSASSPTWLVAAPGGKFSVTPGGLGSRSSPTIPAYTLEYYTLTSPKPYYILTSPKPEMETLAPFSQVSLHPHLSVSGTNRRGLPTQPGHPGLHPVRPPASSGSPCFQPQVSSAGRPASPSLPPRP